MDFELSDEQRMIRQAVREFAEKEIAPHARHVDETGEFPAETFRKMGELGLMGIPFPEEYGGAGADFLYEKGTILVREEHYDRVHAILEQRRGPAVTRIKESALTEVVVTNTIPISEEARATGRFKVVSIARLLAEAIRRIHHSDSVSSLFV